MSSTSSIPEQYLEYFGFMRGIDGGLFTTYLEAGFPWCLDNCAFTGGFCENLWDEKLEAYSKYKDTCLFIVIPDVVGNYAATIAQFQEYAERASVFGYPVALVSQDGLMPEETPWDKFEVLFVGGTDEHKLGREAGALIDEAIRQGKWVHIGRVNSPSRIRQFWRADSWDGTHLNYEPRTAAAKIAKAVRDVRALKERQYKLWEGI